MTRVAINGFGRIGRNAFKLAFARPDLKVVAINDLTDTKTLAYLLKHDTNYGAYRKTVEYDESHLIVDGHKIKVTAEKDPAMLPWKKLDIDVVIESTGRFVKGEDASLHIKAGSKKVVISAPAKGDDSMVATHVISVNEDSIDVGKHNIFSNASCTTNCEGSSRLYSIRATNDGASSCDRLLPSTGAHHAARVHRARERRSRPQGTGRPPESR